MGWGGTQALPRFVRRYARLRGYTVRTKRYRVDDFRFRRASIGRRRRSEYPFVRTRGTETADGERRERLGRLSAPGTAAVLFVGRPAAVRQ